MKLDMSQLIDDFRRDGLASSKTNDGINSGYNLTNYIYNRQPNTSMWHYVNQDVMIFIDNDLDYSYIEDYGNGVPNWVYSVVQDIKKALKNCKVAA